MGLGGDRVGEDVAREVALGPTKPVEDHVRRHRPSEEDGR
jgi:hypothetical protein